MSGRPVPTSATTQAYGLLMIVIFASVSFQLAAPSEAWARMVSILLSAGALVLALRVSRTRSLVSGRARAIVLAVTALFIAGVVVVDKDAAAPAHALATAIIAFTVVAIALGLVVEARERGTVNVRTVAGVLCIYLLLGLLYANGFQLIDDLSSQQFFATEANPTSNDFLYFSYVTMTTTGYGDFTAATDLGRSVAIGEALTGQIYLVTVVALIVTRVGRPPRRPGEPAA